MVPGPRPSSSRRPAGLAALVAALLAVVTALAPGSGAAATSGSVVGATVPGATLVDNQCVAASARTLGSVSVGSSTTTATGAGRCRFVFGSSNGTATIRLSQRDGVGSAMSRTEAAFTTAQAARPNWTAIETATATVSFAGRSDGRIVRTGDDGTTWNVETSGTANRIAAISAIDATNAYAVGNCGLTCPTIRKRTTAGGTTWATQSPPVGVVMPLSDVAHLPGTPDTAIIVGAGGTILRTTDGGATWNAVASGTTAVLRDVAFASATLAYAVGDGGTLLRSTTAGASWSPIASGTASSLVSVEVAPGPTLFFATGSTVYRSTDPTATTPTVTGIGGPTGTCGIASIQAPAASMLYVAGSYSCGIHQVTDPLAATPTFVKHPYAAVGSGTGLSMRTSTHGMVSNDSGGIDRTTTGTSWTTVLAESSRVLEFDSVGVDHLVAVGGSGFAWFSSDGGTSWTERRTGDLRRLSAVELASPTRAWATSSGGTLFVTNDAGVTWTPVATGTASDLEDIARLEDGTLVVVGASGYVARSTDDGGTWTPVTSGTTAELDIVEQDPGSGRVWIGGPSFAMSSADGARTFVNLGPSPGGGTNDLVAMQPIGGDSAFALTNSVLWRSDDAGATWSAVYSSFTFAADIVAAGPTNLAVTSLSGVSRSFDGGASWSGTSGSTRSTVTLVGGDRIFTGSSAGWIQRLDPGAAVADYLPGAWSGGVGAFGVCLQAVANAAAAWTVDVSGTPGLCQPNDVDPWRAVPASPDSVASTTALGATGSIDLVWGFRAGSAQLAGAYLAPIDVTVVSP